MIFTFFIWIPLVAFVLVFFLLRGPSNYPHHITIGGWMLEFSQVDKVCYAAALIAVLICILAGIIAIWMPMLANLSGRIAGTFALIFLGAAMTLVLNRLMRGGR